MPSDFQILGIEETLDLAAIRKAYRKRVKEVHPDNCGEADRFRNHLLFIQINQAYERLTKGRIVSAAQPGPAQDATPAGAAPTLHKDPAFVFYRTGMGYFMRIHPSRWNARKGSIESNKLPMDDEEREGRRRIVLELVGLFPKAYWYFSIVAHDYPDCPYCADAIEKMGKIEDLTKKYSRILESFSAWPGVAKEKAKRIENIINGTKEALKDEERPLRWPD